jgi:imidazolonepropionase-like amidohydrolase
MPKKAILSGWLLDPLSGNLADSGAVLLDNDRIVAAGTRDAVAIPPDTEMIFADGLTLLPGLIDCHVHLCFPDSGWDLDTRMQLSPSEYLLGGVAAARKTLNAGFTCVRDAGGTPAGFRKAIENGTIVGPRLQVAITILSQTGGHGDHLFPCGARLRWVPLPDIPEEVVDGADEMRKRIRELVRAGADWIKVCASGGVLSPGSAIHQAQFTLEELEVAVAEARRHDRRVMVHALSGAGVKNALHAGAATIEHGFWIDDEAVELFHRQGSTLVPTLIAPVWNVRNAKIGKVPQWVGDKARIGVEAHGKSIERAVAGGVRIAFGSDTGVGPQGTNGEEFVLLRERGLSALDCLRAATTVAAETLGLVGQVGCLTPGAFGDVIGVRGNPLEDIGILANPSRIELVVKGGAVVKHEPGGTSCASEAVLTASR